MTFTVVVTDYDFADLELERDLVTEAGGRLVAAQSETPRDVAEAAAGAGADGLLVQYAPVTTAVFEALDDLVVVGRYGVGVDTVDVEAATAHGVQVVNVPSYCEDEVSTHAFALLLTCVRKTSQYDTAVADGEWDWTAARPIRRLTGQTLGLAGFGSIPRRVADKADAFGLDVVAYDPYVDRETVAEHGAEKVTFGELLARADAVSIHVPLTDETERLFDAAAFERMREHAVVVNTARGAVVDVDDLLAALEAGEVAGAGLDVLPEEPPEPSALLTRDDVVTTPHVAWYSEESYEELRRSATRDVIRAIRGEQPDGLVNDERLDGG
ncbi:MAG: lactate dehydrogenase related dehydrogenase [uncultured archaeon A07HB70]|jgi:Lactate dehydrogenase and related dehydrogenases|nr:MAG: lactate dehydrogenase related dehydrogenase [uncultured archaeon A07HB70]